MSGSPRYYLHGTLMNSRLISHALVILLATLAPLHLVVQGPMLLGAPAPRVPSPELAVQFAPAWPAVAASPRIGITFAADSARKDPWWKLPLIGAGIGAGVAAGGIFLSGFGDACTTCEQDNAAPILRGALIGGAVGIVAELLFQVTGSRMRYRPKTPMHAEPVH